MSLVLRMVLGWAVRKAFVSRLKEPYSTLVLLLASVGLRGEAAIGLQPHDLDATDVWRVIYDRA